MIRQPAILNYGRQPIPILKLVLVSLATKHNTTDDELIRHLTVTSVLKYLNLTVFSATALAYGLTTSGILLPFRY